jgi:hypothetical protein
MGRRPLGREMDEGRTQEECKFSNLSSYSFIAVVAVKGEPQPGVYQISATHRPRQLKMAESVATPAEAYGADFVGQDLTPRDCLS